MRRPTVGGLLIRGGMADRSRDYYDGRDSSRERPPPRSSGEPWLNTDYDGDIGEDDKYRYYDDDREPDIVKKYTSNASSKALVALSAGTRN